MAWIKENGLQKTKKIANHARSLPAKIALRRQLLHAMSETRVFDAFAGSGKMFHEVWKDAAEYAGCDFRWFIDDRMCYVADNRRVLRAIDLQAFNIFDLDAYGSPWEQALIIAERRRVAPGEMIGFAITDGTRLNLKMGGLPLAMRHLAGFKTKVAGGSRLQDEILSMMISGLCRRLKAELISRNVAKGKTGSQVLYLTLLLRGLPA